jgi:hypothetical protein
MASLIIFRILNQQIIPHMLFILIMDIVINLVNVNVSAKVKVIVFFVWKVLQMYGNIIVNYLCLYYL